MQTLWTIVAARIQYLRKFSIVHEARGALLAFLRHILAARVLYLSGMRTTMRAEHSTEDLIRRAQGGEGSAQAELT